MKNFIDQTGALWVRGALVGKMGFIFPTSVTQHGGQDSTVTRQWLAATSQVELEGDAIKGNMLHKLLQDWRPELHDCLKAVM